MSVTEVFYQSALINALIFLWLASLVATTKILVRAEKKVATSMIIGALFGPFALMGAWLYEARAPKKSIALREIRTSPVRSFFGLVIVTAGCIAAFYWLFVANFYQKTTSNEILLSYIALFVVVAGILSGLILAAFTGRIAFIEGCFAAFFLAASALLLKDWANDAFAYGTSAAYFVTLLLSSTMLYLIFLTLGGSFGYLLFGEGKFNPHFSYENFIGTRFLMTKRSSHVVSLISIISVIAVMIACSGMIVVMSVMNGFTSDLRSKILGANAHLMVLKYGKNFSEYESIIEKTKSIPGVIGASAFILNEGLVSSNRSLSSSVITGVDLERVVETGRLKYVSDKALAYLKDPKSIPVASESGSGNGVLLQEDGDAGGQKNQLPGVIIGKEMAEELQVFVGDVVNLISPVGDIGPTGPIPRAKPFRVAGLFYSGMYDFDSKFSFIALADAQDFFNLKNAVTGVEYRVDDTEHTRAIAQEIDGIVGGYPFYTRDWMQMNRNMFSALQLEKIAMLIILGTMIFMASLLILVTLIMVVMEKGKEIAILKSMGATDVSIMKIFVTYGLFVGGLGAILGGTLGFVLCLLVEKVGIRLDPDVYYFSNLPVKIVVSEIFMVVGSAILISFLATIPPSLFAARLNPVDGLRYD